MELEEVIKLMDFHPPLDCSQMEWKWEIVCKTMGIRLTGWNKKMEITVLEIIKTMEGCMSRLVLLAKLRWKQVLNLTSSRDNNSYRVVR